MGTMNITGDQRLSLSDRAIASMIDPRTGQRLRPLGVVGGRTVWPIMGASPDDPSSSESGNKDADDDDDDSESGSDSSEDSDKDGDKSGDSKSKGNNPDAKIEDLEQEKERHFRRRKEAEKERDDLKKQLEELQGKDTPETERLQAQVSDLTTKVQT